MAKAEKAPLPTISPGTRLAGKYVTVRTLAAGGMGMVLLVKHEVLGHEAAIKILRPGTVASRDAAERFLREARASAHLRSHHVARVFDVGSLDDGAPYMLMEYLEGRDLAEELRRRGRMPPEEAVDCILQAIDAVAEAHGIGVIHRDLKPSNLFLVDRPDGSRQIKVLDFGISKLVGVDGGAATLGDVADGAVTTANALLGSPAYMSPEQVKSSKDVDGRTDVWSLGVVLHELVTGCRAFDGDTVGAILSQILTEDVPPLTRFVPDVPRGLPRVVARCLERNRALRYESVLALREDLIPFAPVRTRLSLPPRASLPPAAPAVITSRTPPRVIADETTVDVSSDPDRPGVDTTLAVSSEPAPRDRSAPSTARRARRSIAGPIAAGGAALLAGAIWFAARAGGPAPAPPAQSTRAFGAAPVLDPGPPSVTPAGVAPVGAASGEPAGAAPSATAVATSSVAPTATAAVSASPVAAASAASAPKRPVAPRAARAPSIDLDQRN